VIVAAEPTLTRNQNKNIKMLKGKDIAIIAGIVVVALIVIPFVSNKVKEKREEKDV
jgi:Na+/melibiose symporter-like transporter